MKWLNKLERKYGKYAIPNLMFYVVILYVVGFVFDLIAPEFYYNYLSLDMSAVLRGQIWRLVTFIIQPPATPSGNIPRSTSMKIFPPASSAASLRTTAS